MTSSKSDLEAKEGQIPNESNFLEFVSLLGSLSTRAGGSNTQEEEGPEGKEEVGAAEGGEPQQAGLFLHLNPLYLHVLRSACRCLYMNALSVRIYELLILALERNREFLNSLQ